MKKIYTTLMLVLIASLSFAQISTVTLKDSGDHYPVKKRTMNTLERAGAGSWWIDYTEDLRAYMGLETLEYGGVVFLQDSVATVNFTGGDGRPQFYSYAQVYDLTEQVWVDLYNGKTDENGNPVSVPHFGGTQSITIDSMGCTYAYSRGTNVSADIVDTLVMTIIADASLEYVNLTNYFKQAKLDYYIDGATIAQSSHPKYYQVKYPLTIDDTTNGYFVTQVFPVTGFENISQKTIAVSFSFISATPNRTLASVVGTDINRFSAFYNKDPRTEFATNGSSLLMNEKSNSMCAMEWNVDDATYTWYAKYFNNKVWTGNLMRPGLLIHATCNDCQWVGVKEADQKNIAVRPNPATDNFTVTLVDNTTASIQLYNIVGQMVYNQTTSEQAATINVSDLTSGIYMLKVSQSGKTYTTKVVVK